MINDLYLVDKLKKKYYILFHSANTGKEWNFNEGKIEAEEEEDEKKITSQIWCTAMKLWTKCNGRCVKFIFKLFAYYFYFLIISITFS